MRQELKAGLWTLGLVGVICGIAFSAGAQSNVPIHTEQGGALMTVESGGVLNIASGGAFKIAGTAVTASAAELNALASTGLSATELGFLDGVTAGTSAASKAVVLDASSKIDALDITLLKVGGTDKTTAVAAAVTTPVAGVAAGYKIARGETALDGSNPTPVATGLTTIVACIVSLKGTAAPGVGTSSVTYDWSATNVDLYGWKVTSNADSTLIASTGTETIGWVCIGT